MENSRSIISGRCRRTSLSFLKDPVTNVQMLSKREEKTRNIRCATKQQESATILGVCLVQSDYIYKCKREVKRICPKATINDGVFYCKRHLLQQKISFGHASLHLCIFASFYSPDVDPLHEKFIPMKPRQSC